MSAPAPVATLHRGLAIAGAAVRRYREERAAIVARLKPRCSDCGPIAAESCELRGDIVRATCPCGRTADLRLAP